MKTIVREDVSLGEKSVILDIELDSLVKIYELACTYGILSPSEYEQYLTFFNSCESENAEVTEKAGERKKHRLAQKKGKHEVILPRDVEMFYKDLFMMPPLISDSRKVLMMRLAHEYHLLSDGEYKKIQCFELTISCSNCGSEINEKKKYCTYCGTKL